MTSQQSEQIGAMKRELAELEGVLVQAVRRVQELHGELERFAGACTHPNVRTAAFMGNPVQHKRCPDCGKEWEEALPEPEGESEGGT